MSLFIKYINSWFAAENITDESVNDEEKDLPISTMTLAQLRFVSQNKNPLYTIPARTLIHKTVKELPVKPTAKELNSVHLKLTQPGPARNMPRVMLFKKSLTLLQEINNLVLRKIKVSPKPSAYEPRHPVLKQILKEITRAI
jgi:hypothetical protein